MSLPMLSGSCWTKRTTESSRTAPEILRGFFAPYPPADASCRTSGHTPPNPLTIGFPATQAQTHTPQPPSPLSSPFTSSPIPAGLSSPTPAPTPKAKPSTPLASPPRRHRPTRPSRSARYPRRSPAPPFPHSSPLQALLPPKRSPTRPTLSHHTGTDTHKPATQPAILAAHQLPHSRTSLQPL